MARVDPVPPDEWSERMRAALTAIAPPVGQPPKTRGQRLPRALNNLGTFAHHPDLASAYFPFNAYLLHRATLSDRQRLLLILRDPLPSVGFLPSNGLRAAPSLAVKRFVNAGICARIFALDGQNKNRTMFRICSGREVETGGGHVEGFRRRGSRAGIADAVRGDDRGLGATLHPALMPSLLRWGKAGRRNAKVGSAWTWLRRSPTIAARVALPAEFPG